MKLTAFIEVEIPLTSEDEYDVICDRVSDLLFEQFEHRDVAIGARLGNDHCSVCGAVV